MGHRAHATFKPCHDFSGALPGGFVELTVLERGTSFRCHVQFSTQEARALGCFEGVFEARVIEVRSAQNLERYPCVFALEKR